MLGGAERTEKEFCDLFEAAGLELKHDHSHEITRKNN